jgi:hypothetical protein
MTNRPDEQRQPLLALSPWLRGLITLFLVLLALAHILWPDVAIDAIFLGLLAFAALLWFFDVDTIEWQGIRARRREIAKVRAALKDQAPPQAAAAPTVPPVTKPTPARPAQAPVTVHTRATDLTPPTDKLDRLLWGAEQIRLELIVLLGNAGHLVRVAPWSDYSVVELQRLALEKNIIRTATAEAILTVSKMRNAAVHSQLLDPAADLAMDVVQSLREIPRQYTRIRKQHISLFKDRSLTTPHDTAGVMVVQVTEEGKALSISVFPRETDYDLGRFTTWNWNMDRGFDDEAWYEDPPTHQPRLAFSEAATFAGREYPTQWGLEFRLPRPDLGLDP